MDLGFYPYGNAQERKVGGKWEFTCQHGPSECEGNMIEACGMHFHNATSDWFPFVNCIENSNMAPATVAKSCATKAGWTDWDEINACTTSDLGNQLMHSIAQATDNLQPAHQFTPWVVVNGTPLTSNQLDQQLYRIVCSKYSGSTPPAACKALTSNRIEFKNATSKP